MATVFGTVLRYRFRNDDGSQALASWLAPENTNATLNIVGGANTNFRVRLQIGSIGAGPSALSLMCSYNGGSWFPVNATSSYVTGNASSNLTQGANTTQQLSGPGSPYSFQTASGVVSQASGQSAGITIGSNGAVEVEWALKGLGSLLNNGDTLAFYLTGSGSYLFPVPLSPTIVLHISTSLSPGIYNETTNATGEGIASGTDTYVHGGPYIYNEDSTSIGKGQPSSVDTFLYPGTTFTEQNLATGKGLPSLDFWNNPIGTVYETTQVIGVGLVPSADRQLSIEALPASGVGMPSLTDVYIPSSTPNYYYELTIAIGDGLPSTQDSQKAFDQIKSSGRGISSSSVAVFYAGTTTVTGKGLPFSNGGYGPREIGMATGRGLVAGSDNLKSKDLSSASGHGIPSNVNVHVSSSANQAKGIASPRSTDTVIFADAPRTVGVGSPKSSSGYTANDVSTSTGKGTATPKDNWKSKEYTVASGLGRPSQINSRSLVEVSLATAKGVPAEIDHKVITEIQAVSGKGIPASANQPLTSSRLIPSIRYNIKQISEAWTIPPTAILEALADVETGQDLAYPIISIIAQKPSPISGLAVQDQAIEIPFDLVLVQKRLRDGTDNPSFIRDLLHPIGQRLISDYQQKGGSDIPSCYDTNIVSTPYDRMNEFATHYADLGDEIEIGVLSFTCSVLEFTYAS